MPVGIRKPLSAGVVSLCVLVGGLVFASVPALASEPPEAPSCPNEQLRAEQPYGLKLPDCRAYEMVSPLESKGQDATDSFVGEGPRASVSGEAVTYASRGSFAEPTGETIENRFVSRRGPGGWSTQNITPLHDPFRTETSPSYEETAFTPELTEGIASTNAQLTSEAPAAQGGVFQLYLADFSGGSYRYVGRQGFNPMGSSTDLSRVVLGAQGEVSEWLDGTTVPVNVSNEGEPLEASLGDDAEAPVVGFDTHKDVWHAVSGDGSRVYFTSPGFEETKDSNPVPDNRQLYLRVNTGEPQSPLVSPEASGTGTLTVGSSGVTSLVTATGTFAAGQKISGNGISPGTAVAAVAAGSLMLSKPAASSGGTVELRAGGECTVPADACTVDVSASQRQLENPDGIRSARYWGASADDSKVFFTSKAELTEEADTGPKAANLYECELVEEEAGQKISPKCDLKDLTVPTEAEKVEDPEGAAVQGVVQISEDGSYVYFVADGVLAAGAVGGEPNLYVSHEGGAPVFIATLEAGDRSDWHDGQQHFGGPPLDSEGGPEVNTAAVSPGGKHLAFLSNRELTGYDNHDANTGEPDDEIFLYQADSGKLVCASCNPTGAPPVGSASLSRGANQFAEYRPRDVLEDGVLFFDSSDALVPHTSNGRENVYEYEDGHVYAISDVAGGYESFFMDAGANGENVFFGTADQLLPEDTSNNVVVWDARIGGGFPVTVVPAPCDNGDSCKPPPTPQPGVFGALSSATFSGPGNIAPVAVVKPAVKAKAKPTKCKRGHERKRGKCVRKPKSKKKAKKSTDRKGSK